LITVYLTVLNINRNCITHYFNSYCKWNGIPLSATLLYLKNVLYWPEDDRLRSKHVAVTWPDCIVYFITVMIYCCVLKVYNTLYKANISLNSFSLFRKYRTCFLWGGCLNHLVEFQAHLHTEQSLHYMIGWTFSPRHQSIPAAQTDTCSVNTGDTLFRAVYCRMWKCDGNVSFPFASDVNKQIDFWRFADRASQYNLSN
jgi:hypothetical protein